MLGNVYDYTLGDHRGEGFGREFWISTGIDYAMTIFTGLAAAGLTAAIVTGAGVLLGATAPLWAAVAGAAVIGAGISWWFDRAGAGEWLKEHVNEGLNAWAGVWDNAGTIAQALPGYLGETVVRPVVAAVQERVVQPITQTVQTVSGAVRDVATSVGDAVSGFLGRLFGGHG
jgi:hypothetical protein